MWVASARVSSLTEEKASGYYLLDAPPLLAPPPLHIICQK